MATGKIKKLVHLSQQTYLPNSQRVPDHNDKGYGVIEAEDGRDVHFHLEAVAARHGFDDPRCGPAAEHTLEDGPYRRADFIRLVTIIPVNVERLAA